MPYKINRLPATVKTGPRKHIARFKVLTKHPFAVPVLTILGLLIITGVFIAILNNRPKTMNPNVVVISYDGKQQTVSSKEPTVGELLKKVDIKVNEGDIVEPARTARIQQDDFRINIYRAVPVTVIQGEQKEYTFSAATTPRSMARQSGVTIYPEDDVETRPVTDFVENASIGQEVVINRSIPVNVMLYGAPLHTRTLSATVGDLLREKGVQLKSQDIVSPALTTPITQDMSISVIRNGIATRTILEDIPMPTQNITDNSLSYGVSATRQQGSAGKRAVTYEINTQDGKEVSRRAIQQTIIVQPVTQIKVIGTNLSGIKGDMALAGIAPGEYQYADYIISRESGWCPTKWQGEYGGCPAYHGTPGGGVGYGLCQATPGYKMSTAGADWATNPVTQLKWCTGYARSRYGSWQGAYNHWLSYHNW